MSFVNISLLLCLIIGLNCVFGKSYKNNICRTYEAYNEIETSPDCFYEADVDLNDPEEILKLHVNNYEKHEVTTEDGYINIIYRIPRKNPKGVIILVHPLTGDAIFWLTLVNVSLAYSSFEAGYDVWIPSHRGTYISHKHENKSIDAFTFSDFSFHEMAIYDTRSWVNYIVNKTNRSDIVYVGYSMSAAIPFIYGSLFPEEAKNSIKVFISIAPPYHFKHLNIPFTQQQLLVLEALFRHITNSLHIFHFYTAPLNEVMKKVAMIYPVNRLVTLGLINFFGPDSDDILPEILARILKRLPRGISLKTYYHYFQQMATKRCQYFDYGKKNQEIYGQSIPPLYPVEKMVTPIYLIYSEADLWTTARDVEDLYYNALPPEAKIYGKHKVKNMNHMTYFATKHSQKRIHDHVRSFVDKLFE